MGTEYIITTNGELYHWGIKGMKWGVRRYQRKDGSLTNAGKKRRAKLEAELEKLGGKKDDGEPPKKTMKDMTDDELRAATTRFQLEKSYMDAAKAVAPEVKVSNGKKFVDTFSNKLTDGLAERTANAGADLAAQTLKSVGAKYLNQWLKSTFGDEVDKVAANNKK